MSSPQSDRIRVRRNPKKGRYEREWIESILDRGPVALVARSTTRSTSACGEVVYPAWVGAELLETTWKRPGETRRKTRRRRIAEPTHLGALEANGATVIVLAEGITYFRKKRAFAAMRFDETNVLAISQFPPTQPWAASAAMIRNAVIAALSQAMQEVFFRPATASSSSA